MRVSQLLLIAALALAPLAAMAHDGLGEVELHYHHDGDTAATLERDLRATLADGAVDVTVVQPRLL